MIIIKKKNSEFDFIFSIFQIVVEVEVVNINVVCIHNNSILNKKLNLSSISGRTRSRSNERRGDRHSSRERQDSSRRRSRDRDRDRGRRSGNYRGENDMHNNNGNGPHDAFGVNDGY